MKKKKKLSIGPERALLLPAQADAIVKRLFVNAFGDQAERLVLEGSGKRDLGGWCRGAVRDVILDVLRKS